MRDTVIRLEDVCVDIPLRGVGASRAHDDPRIQRHGRHLMLRALDHVSLEIARGERVGIRGSNGAGKTTLLKVIGGLLPATSGRVTVSASTRALLTVAAGTVPSLTGRQNARIRYALLGLRSTSLQAYVEDVERFAGLGAFFDLPVGSYSPGMQSRLQFAMNTVEPAEILLLDEWMGVADGEFQKKAQDRLLGFIEKNEGFLFASHDAHLVESTTDRQLWLKDGQVVRDDRHDTLLRAAR